MKQNLVLDAAKQNKKENLIAKKKEHGIEIKHFFMKEEKRFETTNKDYFTISFDDKVLYQEAKALEKIFCKTLKAFLSKYHKGKTILFVGLGNSSISGDSFGVKVLEQLIATNQYNDFLTIPKVALFTPDTINKTGISSFKLIEMVVGYLRPDVIILIDSFVTKERKYLNRTIEINDCGIIFADQLRSNKKIDEKTFHIPVLSIGCPFLYEIQKEEYLTKDTLDEDMKRISQIVANSINHMIMS